MRIEENFEEVAGFLFIGDPHAARANPGRRCDDYQASVLGKLREASGLAHLMELKPVILGDLIHRKDESSVALTTELFTTLKGFPSTPVELDGNHGKMSKVPSLGDVEHHLAVVGAIQLVSTPGLVGRYRMAGQVVELYGTPHEYPIPRSLVEYGADLSVHRRRILITHHDMAFGGAYPGAAALHEIEGCDVLVNGHMHRTAPSVVKGQTTLHCPGNIEPVSHEEIDHQPAVWRWAPELGSDLEPHYLAHTRDVFNLTGLEVVAGDSGTAVRELIRSEFVDLMKGDEALSATRTDEAAILKEDVEDVILTSQVSDPAAALLRSILQEVSDKSAQSV